MNARLLPNIAGQTVTLTARKGRVARVPLLPITAVDEFAAIISEAAESGPRGIMAARKQIYHLCMRVCPAWMEGELASIDFQGMCAIVTALLYGERLREEETPKLAQKAAPGVDMEFVLARIMSAFPAYSVEALLRLPVPVISALAALAGRIQADNALSVIAAGAAAALNGMDSYNAIAKIRDGKVARRGGTEYSSAAIAAATAKLDHRELTVIRQETVNNLHEAANHVFKKNTN